MNLKHETVGGKLYSIYRRIKKKGSSLLSKTFLVTEKERTDERQKTCRKYCTIKYNF